MVTVMTMCRDDSVSSVAVSAVVGVTLMKISQRDGVVVVTLTMMMS